MHSGQRCAQRPREFGLRSPTVADLSQRFLTRKMTCARFGTSFPERRDSLCCSVSSVMIPCPHYRLIFRPLIGRNGRFAIDSVSSSAAFPRPGGCCRPAIQVVPAQRRAGGFDGAQRPRAVRDRRVCSVGDRNGRGRFHRGLSVDVLQASRARTSFHHRRPRARNICCRARIGCNGGKSRDLLFTRRRARAGCPSCRT